MVEPEKGFRKWALKLSTALEEDEVGNLKDGCRWISHFLRKVRDKSPEKYMVFEAEARQLYECAALRLWKEATLTLEEAGRHREGSKVRLRHLAGFAYHYSHYVHPLLRVSGRQSVAAETLRSFNSTYLNEIVREGEALEGDWPVFMIRLTKCMEEMGLHMDDAVKEYFVDVMRSRSSPPEITLYHDLLIEAERVKESRLVSGVLLCNAVRMFVRDLCVYYGAESSESFIGPNQDFEEWSFGDRMEYLRSVGRVSVEDVALFTAMNRDLFESVGKGQYPLLSLEDLDQDFREARRFMSLKDGELSESGEDDDDWEDLN